MVIKKLLLVSALLFSYPMRPFAPVTSNETFDSVVGAVEAKKALHDVVTFLKNPAKFKRSGVRVPKGILLVGEPGNGKTLLAKAIAGEAGCPFFSVSGSEFVEIWVGQGPARVRQLFDAARSKAPCIIFIDEIDAVGGKRTGTAGGCREYNNTVNQLLTEMDGFKTDQNYPVIVIAATNRADILDKALTRPGRFDRQVYVGFPNQEERKGILQLYAKKVNISPSVDLNEIAQIADGLSGAELANLVNESALLALRDNRTTIVKTDFEESLDKILLGEKSNLVLSNEEKKITAIHEAGHTLIQALLAKQSNPLYKVTIVPRGTALGLTCSLPRVKYSYSSKDLETSIMIALAGRAAEEIVFNKKMTGASHDFAQATRTAQAMVCRYGMSPNVGPVIYNQIHGGFNCSPETAAEIDKSVKTILLNCYAKVRDLISKNKTKLNKLAESLLQKNTLYAKEIYRLVEEPTPVSGWWRWKLW